MVPSQLPRYSKEQLIEQPKNFRPHVVLLGAGASRAAFPNGDATGRCLPLMKDLVETVGLQNAHQENFEVMYSRLKSQPEHAETANKIEHKIEDYFSGLSLPIHATIYDRLLVSLRPIDAVFTFNWDPFLFDAYLRNLGAVPLPDIFFLHGNVRIGGCLHCEHWGAIGIPCPGCGQPFVKTPLLYPVGEKDYSKDPTIRLSWDKAKKLISEALVLTIFGYGAPESDKDAIELLKSGWFARSDRTMEHVEIIDTEKLEELRKRWSSFTPTHHLQPLKQFEKSWIAQYPRRSREAVMYPMSQGAICDPFPLSPTEDLSTLQAEAAHIASYEAND